MTQANLSSLASSWGSRKSRLAESSRCTRVEVGSQRTGWPRQTSSYPTAGRHVTFPNPRFPDGHDIGRTLQESATLEPFHLCLDDGWQLAQIESAKGLLRRQARLP